MMLTYTPTSRRRCQSATAGSSSPTGIDTIGDSTGSTRQPPASSRARSRRVFAHSRSRSDESLAITRSAARTLAMVAGEPDAVKT